MLTWRDMILDRYEKPKSLLCISFGGGYLFLLLIHNSKTLVFGMKYLHRYDKQLTYQLGAILLWVG